MQMEFGLFSDSQVYFELSDHLLHCNRRVLAKTFLEIVAILPLAVLRKLWGTLLKGVGFLCAAGCLIATLGIFKSVRSAFVKQATSLAANLADWIIFPFAILICFLRLLAGWLIHPSLFFRY